MFKNLDKLSIFSFVSLAVVALLLCFSVSGLYRAVQDEHKAFGKSAELKELSFNLAMASDYLTSEVQKFAVTLNPIHLRNYWDEVNITKTREHVIDRLRELDTPQNEFDLIYEAKNNSDALVNTETHAMRLIMDVYEVPEEQMEPVIRDFKLTQEDKALDFNQKVNKAREILYNKEYDEHKKSIMTPIKTFQSLIGTRIETEIKNIKERTNRFILYVILSTIAAVALMFFLIWTILSRIASPLKEFYNNLLEGNFDKQASYKGIDIVETITEKIYAMQRKNKSKITSPEEPAIKN